MARPIIVLAALEFSVHYLTHLARLGLPDIHPAGANASLALIQSLQLSEDQIVLELGCGTGNTILRIANRRNCYAVGIDISTEMIAAARRRLHKAAAYSALLQATATAIPFRNSSVDRVYTESSIGFHDTPTIKTIFSEIFRVLKPGGLCVANEAIWRENVPQSTIDHVNRQSMIDFGLRPASDSGWSLHDWLAAIKSTGFLALSWQELAMPTPKFASKFSYSRARQRLRVLMSPSVWRNHLIYVQRMATHRASTTLIESRLFVVSKPS